MTVAVAFGEIDIKPQQFAAMAPHLKSELCRLLLDRGFKAAWVSRCCNISVNDVVQLATQRHSFRLGQEIEAVDPVPSPAPIINANEKQQNAIMERLNTQCCRLLVRMPDVGPAYWKNSAALEKDMGIRAGNGMRVVNTLFQQRLIERRRAPRGYEQGWQLTDLGLKLRNSIDENDLPTIVEPQA